jgi:hypothetical protein
MNYLRIRRKLIESLDFESDCFQRRSKLIDKVNLKTYCKPLTLDQMVNMHNLDRELEVLEQIKDFPDNFKIKHLKVEIMKIRGVCLS